MRITSSHLTALQGKHLQNLTSLAELNFTYNSIRIIDADTFKGTENVVKLDFSHNLLTFIPPKLLDPMKSLKTFDASHNNLLHVDDLFLVTNPEVIGLSFNNITDVESALGWNRTNVKSLDLSRNPIEKISNDTFNGRIPHVTSLDLNHCQLRVLNTRYFLELQFLQFLDLSYNCIEEIDDDIPTYITFSFQPAIQLKGNKLRNLGHFPRFYTVAHLERNQIEYLTNMNFWSDTKLVELHLQENKIQWIEPGTFIDMSEMEYLDLSSNLIRSLNGSARHMSRVRDLNLGNNSIRSLAMHEFVGCNKLHRLNLQYNQIKYLGEMQYMPFLESLDVTHNNIEHIRPDQLPESLQRTYLRGNPVKCDCTMMPFFLWVAASGSRSTDIELCFQSDLVTIEQTKSYCPDKCLCECTKSGDVFFISVDCSSKNLSVPPRLLKNIFKKEENATSTSGAHHEPIRMHEFVTNQNVHPSYLIQDRVLGFNLENNSIESLEEFELPSNLIQLFLADNKLRRLPESLFDNLKNLRQVSLSGNPWNCDCNAIRFKKWLTSNHAIIQDANLTLCGRSDKGESSASGKALWTLTDEDICTEDDSMITGVLVSSAVLSSLCFIAIILYRRYKLHVKVFLYSHGLTFVKEKELDQDKRFDAFLSFSDKDGEFICKEIISELEKRGPNINLCIHYRDFIAGEFIHANIAYAVQNSKKTVVFLSNHFLESEWCVQEFHSAHAQTMRDKVHRVIVVILGDLPKEIDPKVQVHLDSTTYLTWGEKYFWSKFLYVLPTSSNTRNPVPRSVVNDEIELSSDCNA